MHEELTRELHLLRHVRDAQADEIRQLREQVRELRRRHGEPQPTGPLKGLKLAVIGPSFRRQDYIDRLTPLGARLEVFDSEDKIGRIAKGCERQHGIIYVKTFGPHEIDERLDPQVDRVGMPYVKLPFKGLDRLEETALAMAPDMHAYRELLEESKSMGSLCLA